MTGLEGQQTSNDPSAPGFTEALTAALSGDEQVFSSLTEPHRLELMTHCYRLLGSVEDAEDQVQETLLRAWRRLETYAGRASFRAWLYKIATNACLDVLASRPKRLLPVDEVDPANLSGSLPMPVFDPVWIEPYPDSWLAPTHASPEARYDAYESISLAFLLALQLLTPRQRAAFILADVLDWAVAEIAETLGVSLSAATSLLHRARLKVKEHQAAGRFDRVNLGIPDEETRQMLDRYASAWEEADIEAIIALLTDDAAFPMPPLPIVFRGKAAVRSLIAGTILAGDAANRWKLRPIQANGQPGFAFYRLDESSGQHQPYALQVLALNHGLIKEAVTFGFPSLFPYFELPGVG